MNLADHPLYGDEPTLRAVTKWLLDNGHYLFQIFQYPDTEWEHSKTLLRVSDPALKARRILSLGCGVGGMESHWQACRPELSFEFVNISQAQLDMMVCEGTKVCADAQTYRSYSPPFDMVLISYLLGHVNIHPTLETALYHLAEGGRLVIYDVFNGTGNFREKLFYETPNLGEVIEFADNHDLFRRVDIAGGIPLAPWFKEHFPWIENEVTPALLVFQKP